MLVVGAFDLEQPLVLFGLELSAVVGVVEELLVELLVGQFLRLLYQFLLLHLLVQELLLQSLVLPGARVVVVVLPDHERHARTVLRLVHRGVLAEVRLFCTLHFRIMRRCTFRAYHEGRL